MILISSPFTKLLRRVKSIPDWIKTYTVPPTLSLTHYEPLNEGLKIQNSDNFVVINRERNAEHFVGHETEDAETIYIRYRGCMDTFGNPKATTSVDSFFKEILKARIVDLEKKMCCGFPFEADGLLERAKQLKVASLVEIAKCLFRLLEEYKSSALKNPQFIVFSNCPTCCEAISEMRNLLKEEGLRERIRVRAKIPEDFDMNQIQFLVKDTAEIALSLSNKIMALNGEKPLIPVEEKSKIKVGLKVPCHNTKAATNAQLDLLKMVFKDVGAFDRCCGLSGTGRLKHPKIGTKISEKLFEQIDEFEPNVVVSGCPSCRDGVKIQREIIQAKGAGESQFEIAGLFEQMMKVMKQ